MLSPSIAAVSGIAVSITGVSFTSRKSKSVTNDTALLPSAFSAGTPGRLKFVSVTSRFSSLTSNPSLMFVPSKTLRRPSPSASVAVLDTSVDGSAPKPASSVSFNPSLSESVSR